MIQQAWDDLELDEKISFMGTFHVAGVVSENSKHLKNRELFKTKEVIVGHYHARVTSEDGGVAFFDIRYWKPFNEWFDKTESWLTQPSKSRYTDIKSRLYVVKLRNKDEYALLCPVIITQELFEMMEEIYNVLRE